MVLADSCGERVRTRINFFCFIMNPDWRKHSVVKYVESWLPENLDYVGPVLKPPARPSPIPTAPPSPRSPALDALLEETLRESTVTKMDEELARLEARSVRGRAIGHRKDLRISTLGKGEAASPRHRKLKGVATSNGEAAL